MAVTTIARIGEDPESVRKAAAEGPVFVFEENEPPLVIIRLDEYKKMGGREPDIVDLLSMPGVEDIDIQLPARQPPAGKPFDFD